MPHHLGEGPARVEGRFPGEAENPLADHVAHHLVGAARDALPPRAEVVGHRAPLRITEMGERLDVFVNVKGSGKNSQSGAVLLGLARALAEHRPDLLPALRDADFLTRDARMVERKKYGHKKARKSFQFSKR